MTLQVDDTLLQQAQDVCAEIGMDLPTALTVFMKKMVRTNGIPFEVRADPFFFAENQAHLLAARDRLEKTGGTVHNLLEVSDD